SHSLSLSLISVSLSLTQVSPTSFSGNFRSSQLRTPLLSPLYFASGGGGYRTEQQAPMNPVFPSNLIPTMVFTWLNMETTVFCSNHNSQFQKTNPTSPEHKPRGNVFDNRLKITVWAIPKIFLRLPQNRVSHVGDGDLRLYVWGALPSEDSNMYS
ncbi:hypothetical protein M8C21_028728, partial [Ambrosia artemisiifolia]